ncbi:hypothetical protein [Caulobacter sp. LARHSG274]
MKRTMCKPLPARLTHRRRLAVNLSGLVLWGSGVVWLGLHYFAVRQGEFGPEQSPVEPWALKVHGAVAFLALWLGGLLWGVHVVNGWGQNRRRVSGGVLLGGFLLLIVSGYLLYYGGEAGRPAISLFHWVLGLGLPALYVAHRILERRKAAG